ncbi:MAG: DUF1735 domain-containing protein [Chitinophagaceae bacterium]
MKRYLNKTGGVIILAAGIFLMSSCLKNNNFYTDFSHYKPSIELPLAATYVNLPFPEAIDVSNQPVEYPVVINVASVNPLNQTVTATLAVDKAYLDQYNAQQDAATKQKQADYLAADPSHKVSDKDYPDDYDPYELLPDSLYTADSWNLTVSAGQRQARMNFKIATSKMDLDGKYVLPVTITQASIDISSWNHLMIYFTPKNKYDGKYTVTGKFVDMTNPAFTDKYPMSVSLVTQGASSVAYFDNDLNGGTFGYLFYTGTGGSYYGNWAPVFIFDNDNNVVEVVNYYGQGTNSSKRSGRLDPAGVNKFDPATKTLKVSYYMVQAGADRCHFEENFDYKGPR